ncbi:MAG: TonB-system energizer ExbB [Spirochaetia bacterium]|nr:TonB-system energizer ExbB [Spirochaetia bacterium]
MEVLKNIIDYGIMGILIAMSIGSFSIAIERFLYFKKLDLNNFTDKRFLELQLTNRLYLLASIGSNAPYIGLLGTVMGIILTFYTIGSEGMMDSGKIMIALALAMKVTAAGLVVAIPSIFIYNFLIRRVRVILTTWEIENGR